MLSFGSSTKLVRVVANGTGSALTGTTAETEIGTYTLPAGMLGATGMVRVTAFYSMVGTAGTKAPRIKFGGNNFVANSNAAAVLSQNLIGLVINKTAATQTATALGSATGLGAVASSSLSFAVDTTAPVVIQFTGQLGSAADSMTLDRYIIEVVR